MGSKLYHVIFWLALMYTPYSTEDQNFKLPRGNWKHHTGINKPQLRCKIIKPTPRDIVRRIYAILPYFDKEHQNSPFLHKYRGTINKMSESEDMLNRDAAFYAAVLTPVIYLQRYRDARCLLERTTYHTNCNHTVLKAGAAAESAAKLKHAKYSNLEPMYDFVPVAVETSGPWCSETKSFTKRLGQRLRERGGDPKSGSYPVQQISFAFERALCQLQTYAPSQKRAVLKHLQNWRDISNKVRLFVGSLPDKRAPTRTPMLELEDRRDKKDIQFLKELIKSLG